MELYLSSSFNPVQFVSGTLPGLYHAKTIPEEPLQYGGMFDKKLFGRFRDQFNCISITSGLPKNDYGQTVRLYRVEAVRGLDELEWSIIPEHLIGPNLPLKTSEMTGRFGYKKTEDRRSDQLFVEEGFFFEFQPGYSLKTFAMLGSSLATLRYLSTALHKLYMFEVVLGEEGVLVRVRASIGDSHKPDFTMEY